jgi:hypothetical protein
VVGWMESKYIGCRTWPRRSTEFAGSRYLSFSLSIQRTSSRSFSLPLP